MLSKRTRGLLLTALLLSLIAAGLAAWLGRSVDLNHVVALERVGDIIYGVDERAEDYLLFQTDASGARLGTITLPMTGDGVYHHYGELSADGGSLYLLETRSDVLSGLILSERVYRCDFDAGRLEAVWDLPIRDPSMTTNLSPRVREGVLTFFQTDYTGMAATARLFRWPQGGEPEEFASFTHDIGEGFTEFYYAASGRIAFTTPTGSVYVCAAQPGAETRKIFPQEGTKALVLFANDGGDVVYVAGTDSMIYALDLSGAALPRLVINGEDRFSGEGQAGLRHMDFLTFAGTDRMASVEERGRVVLFQPEGDVRLEALSASGGSVALRALLAFLAVWAAAAVLYLLCRGFFFLTRGTVPILTKLLAVFLPVLIISLILLNGQVTRFFTERMEDQQYERLFLLTGQQTATLNANYIRDTDLSAPYDTIYFYEIRAALNVLPQQGELYHEDGELDPQRTYNSNYFWLYKLEDGQLRSMICEQDYIGVPVEFSYSAATSALFYRVAETGLPVRTEFSDRLGDWTVLLTPVVDESGQVVAVLETGDSAFSLRAEVEEGADWIARLNLSVMAVLAVLLSAVIACSLHPLGILKARVEEISGGKLGVQAPERGSDEVSQVIRVFNTMSRNVAFRDKEIRDTSDGYARFVPSRVFSLLEKSSVIDVRLADQTSVEAAVLNCWVEGFDDIARTLRSGEMFRLINQVLARLVPVVDAAGGLVDRFDRAGLLAIYTHQSGAALDSAVTLCQTLRGFRPEGAASDAPLPFHVVLSAGPAMIGIVGAEKRLEAMTISEHTSFTGFLRPLAASYGASVLMTGSAAGSIPDFESRYHARTIGFVYMRTLDKLERLYDVYDGDDETTRLLKEETREDFEKGVALFCSREYYDARLLFIEVLKRNRRDAAAKNYLYLCDTCYQSGDSGERPVWLEAF